MQRRVNRVFGNQSMFGGSHLNREANFIFYDSSWVNNDYQDGFACVVVEQEVIKAVEVGWSVSCKSPNYSEWKGSHLGLMAGKLFSPSVLVYALIRPTLCGLFKLVSGTVRGVLKYID